MRTGKNPISPDVLCELAHELTARECSKKGIVLDVETDDETNYTAKAQDIFIELYDLACRILVPDEGGQP